MDPISGGADYYQYDADGRRIHRQTAVFTGGYIYDSEGNHIADVDPNGMVVLGEVYANGKHLATLSTGSNPGIPASVYFHHTDWLGTERVRSNGYGEIYETCTSWVYGDHLQCSTNDVTQTHFTGKERDQESGLDYFGARYYGSSMGRMMSPDPGNIGVDRTNPQTWNMYSYGLNNPLQLTDPTGMYVCEDSTECSSHNDQNFAKALAAAQNAVNGLAAGADRDSAQRAIDAYGAQGVDNGVNVRFDANISEPGGVTEVSGIANGNKSADNPTGQNINVTFKPDAINTDWSGGLAAHEGSHVADASAWVSSGFSASMNPTSNATELRAYQVQFNVMNGIGNNLYGPNGTFSANMQYGNARVDWKKGDSFKLPEFQILIKTENGNRDSKPAFTAGKGAAIQP